ncbi:ABC transporter permease [Roseofilum sp. SID3]|uniref:ABC transporter permease n=1 Tax=unclassified Roseofilum TaxID=2620099 RepID=UPI001B2CD759|nr:ABC transporter permease [Roseofilum sp. Belize Diploria]MBP0013443.1 ABC transporter permease [Roseofilum sp. SID3]MBP0023027.1 ABC transporter permease [Roseofilum sp. SID2]MBP0032298.1 ABC transporter permease [Roseofilum sp. Belize BBD 4]MBP0040268.1 ABC transporter permease [Roseofilum sp. SID1]MBP0043098.1 ABC transporter permease [Roseofilum sp. SBFL]
MLMTALLGAIELGLLYSLVGLGVYLSFRVLDFPDLTVDGSFPLGGAVAATLIVNGMHPIIATAVAIAAGALSGACTAWLTVQFKILNLLSSILTMIALYSLNLRIMGRPNVPLLGETTLFSPLNSLSVPRQVVIPIILVIIVILLKVSLDALLATQWGLALRATGANSTMARAQGVDPGMMIIVGMALSNALVALAGALFAQIYGFADVTLGVGTIVLGLAAVIIGETFIPGKTIFQGTLSVILGALAYRLAIAVALNANFMGLQAQDLNLVTALLVAIALILPQTPLKKLTLKN